MTVYRAGDVLQECEPFALLLLEMNKGKNCDYCCRLLDKPKRCATCRTMYYCSRECANSDWKLGHKFKECQVLKDNDMMAMVKSVLAEARSFREPVSFMTTLKFILRLILKKTFDSTYSQKLKMADGTLIGFEDMADYSGTQHIESQPLLTKLLNIVKTALAKCAIEVSDDDVWKMYLKYVENSIGVSPYLFTTGNRPLGRGIYVYKEFPHSCCNNCTRVNDGVKTYIRAIRDFNTEDEPPSFCQVDVREIRTERQETLFLKFDINCECDRCLADIEFPDNTAMMAKIRNAPNPQALRTLRKYVSDTKKVHKGGRSLQVFMNTYTACMILKARQMFRELREFERDMEITTKVLYGDNGWAKAQAELEDPTLRSRLLNLA